MRISLFKSSSFPYKTIGAWILTGGTSTGVTRHVGDALISERSPRLRGGRVVSIGVAPWGVVENRASLIGRKKDVAYQSIDHPRSKFAALNNRHAYFLLADNGTVGRLNTFTPPGFYWI
jgi:transient receptor potential cation channel subfamily M protein 3